MTRCRIARVPPSSPVFGSESRSEAAGFDATEHGATSMSESSNCSGPSNCGRIVS
jgi:hypothetical protein